MEPVQQRGLTHNMYSMTCMEIVPHDLVPCLITTPDYIPLGGSSPPYINLSGEVIRRYMFKIMRYQPKTTSVHEKKDVTKIRTTIYIYMYM